MIWLFMFIAKSTLKFVLKQLSSDNLNFNYTCKADLPIISVAEGVHVDAHFSGSFSSVMSSHTYGSTQAINGSLKKIRLWSDEKLVDWKLDLSRMRSEAEIKELIAAQFGRSAGS